MSTHGEAVEDIKKAKGVLESMTQANPKQPDPVKHFKLSMYKSAVRILAGGLIAFIGYETNVWLLVAGSCIIIAEIIGIAEEMV
jgi:hypothetical protein